MAKLIKIAGNTNPTIKLSSSEWLRTGLSYNMLYKDDKGLIKVAQASAADIEIQRLFSTKDPATIAGFDKAGKSIVEFNKRVPGVKYVPVPTPGGGNWGTVDKVTGKINVPGFGRGAYNLRGMINRIFGVPPVPPVPPPKPGMSLGKGLGMAGAGLLGGAAGYYGAGAIADAMKDNNQMTRYDPDNFYRGVSSFQTAMSPVLGISKVLAKETKEVMATIAELQQQMTANDPGTRSPSMMKKDEVEQAMTSANAPPASGADYLPN